ncbi:MAG TPA: hypothetical protein VES67_20025 [Vicinamibacterales bacterium]|nr:hypothetical protein [Vicinamibacterales bacterium]
MRDDGPPPIPPGYTAVQLFSDPTPNAVINQRLLAPLMQMRRYADLTAAEGSHYADLMILIGRKLASVWKHLDQYRTEEGRLVEEFRQKPSVDHVQWDPSQVLFSEFDEFTVQIKSTLDHLVKVMVPMLGQRKWTLRTFENKGEGVLNALKRNTGKKHEGRVRMMEALLFERHVGWLDAVIGARDRVNHYLDGGINIHVFSVARNPDGTVEVPMWSKQEKLRDVMEFFWSALIKFVEDFVVLALNFRMSDEYGLVRADVPADRPVSPWKVVPASVTKQMSESHRAKPL